MVSFISIFCHVYLLTSLLEPTATLDVTYCLYRQLQQHYTQARTRMNASNAAQLLLSTGALFVQTFVLLGVLLIISLVELQQLLTKTHPQIIPAPSSTAAKGQTTKNKDAPTSPLLLPTPPCEKEVPNPTKMMMNGGDPPINDQDDAVVRPAKETKAMDAPNEPATPPDEARSKQQQQQQQQTTTKDKDNEVNCSEQPEIKNAATELDRQDPLPDIQKPLSSTTMQCKSESNKNSNNTILDSSAHPALTKNTLSFPSPKETHGHMTNTTTTLSDMPDHTPNDSSLDLSPLPSSTTPTTKLSKNETTKATEDEQEQNNISPASLPLLSPSASLSSSLSTLNHATHSNTSPQEPSITGSEGHISHFHRSFIKSQQQQKQPEEINSSPPFPVSIHSSKTHVSNVSSSPKPLGSSLSMKLNKLKQPGRRISQLFKKKKQSSS